MQPKIKGNLLPPKSEKQKALYKNLAQWEAWVKRPKDLAQIQQETQNTAPKAVLPMVF